MMRRRQIAPSILSADFGRLADEIRAVEKAGADLIHLDIMDGHFVPNITAGPVVVEAARRATGLPLDAHLMIENPEKYIPEFAKAGASSITVHVETCPRMEQTLRQIRGCGAAAAVSLNPDTPVESVLPFLPQVAMVLVMSVHPGFGGQSFIDSSLEKVRRLREAIDKKGLNVEIETDGGIKVDNIGRVAEAGATIFVAGSAIFKSGDYAGTIRTMKNAISR